MDIVVDASVIIAIASNEEDKPRLIGLTAGGDLIAPSSVHWEIGNAFSAMLRRGRVTLHQALQAIGVYYRIPVRFVDVELEESLRLAAELNIYAYDAYLIRCAFKYGAPLLSLDHALLRVARSKGLAVLEVNR
jgi:predicted nucleic acid-binding protein